MMQYAETVINCEKVGKDSERITKINSFLNFIIETE